MQLSWTIYCSVILQGSNSSHHVGDKEGLWSLAESRMVSIVIKLTGAELELNVNQVYQI